AAIVLSGVVAAVALPGGLSAPSAPSGPAVQAAAPPAAAEIRKRSAACAVGYAVSGTTDGRFTTKVSIANTGKVAIPAARLTFTLPGEQRLRDGAPGTWRQQGRTISAQIGDLAAGRSRTATIRGTYEAASALPDRFELNGTACRTSLLVVGTSTKPPPPKKTRSAVKAQPESESKSEAKKAKKETKKSSDDEDEDEEDEDE
ncbi:cellulose binding domain-containing protein, partial [Actinoplanes sp. NPDC024001]|uniref:cellulose binding domain-containing protein n=1 Tax=Actinoplanes sp. NPDC024001 TaxID=3154598 RepID=UPI0033F67AD8